MNYVHRLIHDGADSWLESFALMVICALSGVALLTAAVMAAGITLHLLMQGA